jgi:hypothetical protein
MSGGVKRPIYSNSSASLKQFLPYCKEIWCICRERRKRLRFWVIKKLLHIDLMNRNIPIVDWTHLLKDLQVSFHLFS